MSTQSHGHDLSPYEALWALGAAITSYEKNGHAIGEGAKRRVYIAEISHKFDVAGCSYVEFDYPAWRYVYTGEEKYLNLLYALASKYKIEFGKFDA